MNIIIRKMKESDIVSFHNAFNEQGWDKPISLFEKYFKEQNEGTRKLFVAEYDNTPIGYATLLPNDKCGAFADKNIPTICDFNVLEKYQGNGAGKLILDEIETEVREYSDEICLGVGLHSGYGPAQRIYVKRGYVPDGSGVWYKDKQLEKYTPCVNDDELVLYMSKKLR